MNAWIRIVFQTEYSDTWEKVIITVEEWKDLPVFLLFWDLELKILFEWLKHQIDSFIFYFVKSRRIPLNETNICFLDIVVAGCDQCHHRRFHHLNSYADRYARSRVNEESTEYLWGIVLVYSECSDALFVEDKRRGIREQILG